MKLILSTSINPLKQNVQDENIFEAADHECKDTEVVHQLNETTIFIATTPVKKNTFCSSFY